jgi:uncharacterized phiE125 gp8 family phage protein
MRFYNFRVVTPPAELPVTVQEYIDHARLNGLTVDRQPDLIDRKLRAATSRAEQYLRCSLLTQTLEALYLTDGLDCRCALLMVLPRGRVQTVLSIVSDGQTLDPATYRLTAWNVLELTTPLSQPATVQFESGYGADPQTIPEPIREGILDYATVLYETRTGDRDEKYQGNLSRTLPAGIIDLWRPFQIELSG